MLAKTHYLASSAKGVFHKPDASAKAPRWRFRLVSSEALARRILATTRNGTTTVEVALVTPCVLFVLVGMLDLGLATYSSNTLAEAVRAGARYAIVHGSNSTSPAGPDANSAAVANAVLASAPGIRSTQLEISSTWPDGINDYGNRVTVSATYNYNSCVAWMIGKPTIPLRASTTMEISH